MSSGPSLDGADGGLLGADFSVLKAKDQPPKFGESTPGRWSDSTVTSIMCSNSSGALSYDHRVMNPAFAAAGGDVEHPNAVTLVTLGKVKSADEVATIFEFPTIYDLVHWVAPLVHASKT